MKIATVQLAPRLGDVAGNIKRADALLEKLKFDPQNEETVGNALDLLVLPEMAFSGYNFSSIKTIKPYLEPTGAGPSSQWARSTAQRLGCTVCVGYPESAEPGPSQSLSGITTGGTVVHHEQSRSSDDDAEARFNSVLVVDAQGNTLSQYQKRFLYYTDETWAQEGRNGEGFFQLPVRTRKLGKTKNTSDDATTSSSNEDNAEISQIPTSVGICMDINPYKFTAPYTAYEFAHQVRNAGSKLVILSTAWITYLSKEELETLSHKPDMDTFQYWIQRFWPLISDEEDIGNNTAEAGDGEQEKETIVVFANRCGEEEGLEGRDAVRYAGTSCVLGIRRRRKLAGHDTKEEDSDDSGTSTKWRSDVDIVVWDILGRGEDGLCVVDTDSPPKKIFKVRSSLD